MKAASSTKCCKSEFGLSYTFVVRFMFSVSVPGVLCFELLDKFYSETFKHLFIYLEVAEEREREWVKVFLLLGHSPDGTSRQLRSGQVRPKP